MQTSRNAPQGTRSLDKYSPDSKAVQNIERLSQRAANNRNTSQFQNPNGLQEKKTSRGNIIALACGKLQRPRYINPKIETELLDFKKEIEEKFIKSKLRTFKFPLKKQTSKVPESMHSSRYIESDGPFISGRRQIN
jgi:hypothetical protein